MNFIILTILIFSLLMGFGMLLNYLTDKLDETMDELSKNRRI